MITAWNQKMVSSQYPTTDPILSEWAKSLMMSRKPSNEPRTTCTQSTRRLYLPPSYWSSRFLYSNPSMLRHLNPWAPWSPYYLEDSWAPWYPQYSEDSWAPWYPQYSEDSWAPWYP